MSSAGLLAGCGVDFPVHAALYTNRKNTINLPARFISGQFRVLLSAFAPVSDSFCFFLIDSAGCAMK
jgi:hypothetical protein